MRFAIVDLQGFKSGSNEFVVKEAAVLINGSKPSQWIFEPPYSWHELTPFEKRQAIWLSKKHHGLKWSEGCVPYNRARDLIRAALRDASVVYVKGFEKQKWLMELVGLQSFDISALLLDDENVPRLCELPPGAYRCTRHDGVCALENVFKLQSFLQFYQNSA